MEIEIKSQNKKESAKSSILKTSIRGPLVVMVLLLTFGLTTLFYFSQDSQNDVYARYIETLSDYKFLETRAMRPMERIRYGFEDDSAAIDAGLMVLRELAVSVSSSMEGYRKDAGWNSLLNRVDMFEREVFNKVSISRRFLKDYRAFSAKLLSLHDVAWTLPDDERKTLFYCLRTMQFGNSPDQENLDLPDSLKTKLQQLAAENLELATIWSRIDNPKAMLLAEDIIGDLKSRSVVNIEWKATFSLVFYLLSLALLLVTLILYVRVKHD